MTANDERNRKRLLAFCAILLATILVGEVCVYSMSYTNYGVDVEYDGSRIQYSVHSEGAKNYSIIVNSNEGNESYCPVRTVYLYLDKSYPSLNRYISSADGQSIVDEHFLDQLSKHLRYRNICDVQYIDAAGLKAIMEQSVREDSCHGTGVVVTSGVLPDTVYTGEPDDILMRWMDNGGTLYWTMGVLGQKYCTAQGEVVDVEDFQKLFFNGNNDCLNYLDGPDKAYEDIPDNGYREALCLSNNNLYGSVILDNLVGIRCLPLGYWDSELGIASNATVQYGDGAFVVIGGVYALNEVYDLAQIIGSGVSPWSELVCVINGNVDGEVVGTQVLDEECVTIYAFLGGYFPVYGINYYFLSTNQKLI